MDEFLEAASRDYELVVFTASVPCYGNPIISKLDTGYLIKHRIFRSDCTFAGNGFMKDLRKLGRDLKATVIIDNCPLSYALQPNNAIPITTWLGDRSDNQLKELIPVLSALAKVPDVRESLKKIVRYNRVEKNYALRILKEEVDTLASAVDNSRTSKEKSKLEQTAANNSEPPVLQSANLLSNSAARRQARTMLAYKHTDEVSNSPAPINDMQRFANVKFNSFKDYKSVNVNDRALKDSAISMIKQPQNNLISKVTIVESSKASIASAEERQPPKTAKVNYHYLSMNQWKLEVEENKGVRMGRQNLIGVNFYNPLKEASKAGAYQVSGLAPYPGTSKVQTRDRFAPRSNWINAGQSRGSVIA